MAITINGSANTVAGLAVGGLPDGTVDNDTLAAGAGKPANNAITNALLADDAVGIAELSATGTASSSTFLRGDNAWAEAGGGKILKVQSTQSTTNLNSTSTSWTHWNQLDNVYTPTAADSTLYIVTALGSTKAWDSNVSDAPIAYVAVSDDDNSTRLWEGGIAVQASGGSVTGTELDTSFTNIWKEAASSTSERTFKLYYKLGRGTSMQINAWSSSSSTLTVIEVAA